MGQACLNLRWAAALLDGLARGGLRWLVLSPGSRSTPLVLAAERQRGVTIETVVDERAAAFFGLGLARATGAPVALVATSGSAPAHWYPAVIEASEWGVPLVLISADRPPELRAWGANQTIDQTRMFGGFVREFHDPGPPRPGAEPAMSALGARLAQVSRGPRPGPVHVNLPFPEPLVPDQDCGLAPTAPPRDPAVRGACPIPDTLPARLAPHLRGRGLIVCGPDDYPPSLGPALWRLAQALCLPVLVDPLAGLRFGPAPEVRVTHYDALVRHRGLAERLRPAWAIRFGRAPVSKHLNLWLRGVPTVLVDPAERWLDPEHSAVEQVRADGGAFCGWLEGAGLVPPDEPWQALWRRAERRAEAVAASHLESAPWSEGQLMRALLARLPGDHDLFVANSLPVRQLDTWSGSRDRGPGVYGNRGVSGIDGQLATLAGLNAGGRPTVGVIGDLAFWHDMGSLLLAPRLRAPLVVVNNGGGGIFGYLPQRALETFEVHWRTPVHHDIGGAVQGLGLGHRAVDDLTGFAAALDGAFTAGTAAVIEARVDAAASQAVHQGYWQRIGDDPELSGLQG